MKQAQTIEQRATDVINRLKQSFLNDSTVFGFHCSQYISGMVNRELRREITRQLTGEVKPFYECGMFPVVDLMKASFQQYSLFTA